MTDIQTPIDQAMHMYSLARVYLFYSDNDMTRKRRLHGTADLFEPSQFTDMLNILLASRSSRIH